MKLNRREFIEQSALGAGVALLGARLAPAAETATFDPFEKVPLGKSGLKVTRTCLGTGMRGGNRQSNHTRMGQEKFTELVRGAYDRGVRCFDLADLYGTHPFFAKAMKGVPRDSYAVITKLWVRPGGGIPEKERPDANIVVDRFLKELETDRIELALLHCMTEEDWSDEFRRQMDILAGLKKKGVIGALGVSCHSTVALELAAKESWVDSVHARINPEGVSMDDKDPAVVVAALRKIHEAGKGVVGMKIMGEGRFREASGSRSADERRDASVKYVLNLGCVDVLNVGCENLAEVDDLIARIRKAPRSA